MTVPELYFGLMIMEKESMNPVADGTFGMKNIFVHFVAYGMSMV